MGALVAEIVYWSVQAERAESDFYNAMLWGKGKEAASALSDFCLAMDTLKILRYYWEQR